MSEAAARVGPSNMWGTWEELILGSAVERHGTDDWNVIVSELRARTAYHDICTPEICKAKYEDLLAHFSCLADLIEELRKRRMDELRRDLARSNDNISSLESKLRSLQLKKEPEDGSNNEDDNAETLRTKSNNLMEIFNSISESKAASVFKYRRQSQKQARYRELVKQHVDMESIRSKITEETIKSAQELFRDLLLLSNNALVFYSSRSREYKSALAFRDLVKCEYKSYCRRSCNEAAPPIITPSFDPTVHKRRRSIRLRPQPPPPPLPDNVNSNSDDEEEAETSEDDPSDDSDQDFSPRSLSFKGKKRSVLRRAKPKKASGK